MAEDVQLEQIPNQSFLLLVEEDLYIITLRTISTETYVTLLRNGEKLVDSIKAMPNQNILLYNYQFNEHGNFVFTSLDDEYPLFSNFGVSTFFQYVTKQEVVDAS